MTDHDFARALTLHIQSDEPHFALDPAIAEAQGGRMRARRRRRLVVLAAGGLVLSSVIAAAAIARLGNDQRPDPALPANMAGSMSISPARVSAGQEVQLTFPTNNERGIAFSLAEWTDDRWQISYFLISDHGDTAYEPTWWTVEESENRGWEQIAVSGPGPDRVVIPTTAGQGAYLLCTANAVEKACATVNVT